MVVKRPTLRIRWLFWPRRFGVQLAIIFTLSLALSMTLFTYYSAERESNRIATSMRLQAGVLAENLAATSGDYLLTRDYASIENALLRAARFPGVRSIQLVDKSGKRLGDVTEEPGDEPRLLYGRPSLDVPFTEMQHVSNEDDQLVIWQPIVLGELLGWTRVSYSLHEVSEARRAVWEQNALSAGIIVTIVLLLLHLFMRRPIKALARYTDFADNLDANLGERTSVYRASIELEKLGGALNRVSRRLADQDTAIQEAMGDLRRLAAFPENDPNLVISLDTHGEIHYLNPAAKAFLEADQRGTESIVTLLPRDISATAASCIATNTARRGIESITNDRTFLWTLAPVRSDGLLHCYAVEITELKRAEEQAKAALIDKLSAEAASSAKSQFLAIMSHEIRTPMNGVLGMTELLLGTTLDNRQRRFAEIARGSAQSLLAIINDILDFSKIEAGKLELESMDLDLRSLLEEICTLFAEQAFRKNLELLCVIPPDAPTAFRGDYNRLRQIFTNLVGNAIKFTHEGEIVLTMTLTTESEGKPTVRFEVRDTGIGIPVNAQAKVFDSFSQADGSTTRHYGGTGLGLAICKQLAQLMGGTIGVTSVPGRGSTFWFTVRLEPATQCGVPATLPDNAAKRIKALIADCHPLSRQTLQQQLQAWHVTHASAMTDEDAINQLRLAVAHDAPFTAIIIDHHHDHDRTLRLMDSIKQDAALADVAVILPMPAQHVTDVGAHTQYRNVVAIEKPMRQSGLLEALKSSLVERHETPTSHDQADTTERNAQARLENAYVLVAEDNPVNQELARYALEGLGCRTHIVANGEEAVAAFARERFDVILMDCQMPRLDGYAATEQIRAVERQRGGRRTPIIALTANAIDGDRERCMTAQMNDYLSKPFTLAELGEVLVKWLPTTRTPAYPTPGLTISQAQP